MAALYQICNVDKKQKIPGHINSSGDGNYGNIDRMLKGTYSTVALALLLWNKEKHDVSEIFLQPQVRMIKELEALGFEIGSWCGDGIAIASDHAYGHFNDIELENSACLADEASHKWPDAFPIISRSAKLLRSILKSTKLAPLGDIDGKKARQIFVNIDKYEYIDLSFVSCHRDTLYSMFSEFTLATPLMVHLLVYESVLVNPIKHRGTWMGDRVGIIGNYCKPLIGDKGEVQMESLYNHAVRNYKDITKSSIHEIETYCPKVIGQIENTRGRIEYYDNAKAYHNQFLKGEQKLKRQ